MKRNRFLFFFIMLLSFTIFVTDRPFVSVDGQDKVPVVPLEPLKWSSDYSVIGNTVSMNNSDLEMSVWPHTSSGGWVYCSFSAKKFRTVNGSIDLLFGFTEDDRVSLSKLEVYDPYSVRDDYNTTIDSKYYDSKSGFSLGFTSHLLTFYERDVKGQRQAISSVTFDDYGFTEFKGYWNYSNFEKPVYVNQSYTVGWYTTHSYHVVEYRKFSEQVFKKAHYKVTGEAENWVSVPVQRDSRKTWTVRFWLDVVPTLEENCIGEYWVGVKSSDESLTDALKFRHYTAMDPWWDASWQYKMKLTVDHTLIDADLTWFPVTVFYDSGNMNWSNCQDDLDDIRFVTGNESVLLCAELEDYTVNTDAVIHVSKDGWVLDSDVDTDFYCYFGNPTAASAWDGENVWNDDYVMVQHMVDITTSHIHDSTANNNDGNKKAANEPIETASGQINSAQNFDGNDYINMGNVLNFERTDPLSISMWVKTASGTGYPNLLSKRDTNLGTKEDHYTLYIRATTGYVGFIEFDGLNTGGSMEVWEDAISVIDNVLHHIEVSYTGSSTAAGVTIYVDGIPRNKFVASDTLAASILHTDPLYLGCRTGNNQYFTGVEDEVRFSDIVHPPAWILAEYYSGVDGLLSYGAESELLPPSIGELQAPVIVYPNKYIFLNVTARYDTGRANIKNVTLLIDGGVKLWWNESNKLFGELADPSGYVTLNATGSTYVNVNASAYRVCWRVMFANTYPEGYVDAIASGTKVYTDDDMSASGSKADWFLFTVPPADFAWILALLIAVAALALILLFTKK